jgi:HSP20 family protein
MLVTVSRNTTRKEIEMASVIPYDPFVDTGFDDLFRGFFRPVRAEGRDTPAGIKMDVSEDDKSYTVHAEIPGVNKDDIHVTIEGNQVTVGAEVKREKDVKDGERVLRSERYYGSAYRSFTLPTEVDESTSQAKYDKGVLELKLAKKPTLAGKRLSVQ